MIKTIIFDFGRVLYDPEIQELFPDVKEILTYLSSKYELAIVSLASDGNIERREKLLKVNKIDKLFKRITFVTIDKDSAYAETFDKLKLNPQEVVIVDDRVIRGIKWGNLHGTQTIWLQKDKFAEEEPTSETGNPTHIIRDLSELYTLL